jgi:hypothetical protein
MMGANTSDILEIDVKANVVTVKCQATGADTITLYDSTNGKAMTQQVTQPGVYTLKINR